MACALSPPFWPWCRVLHIRPRLAGKSSRSDAKAPSGSCASCAAHQQGAALAQHGCAGKTGKGSPGTLAPERRPVVHKHGSAGRFSTLRPLMAGFGLQWQGAAAQGLGRAPGQELPKAIRCGGCAFPSHRGMPAKARPSEKWRGGAKGGGQDCQAAGALPGARRGAPGPFSRPPSSLSPCAPLMLSWRPSWSRQNWLAFGHGQSGGGIRCAAAPLAISLPAASGCPTLPVRWARAPAAGPGDPMAMAAAGAPAAMRRPVSAPQTAPCLSPLGGSRARLPQFPPAASVAASAPAMGRD